MNFGLIADGNRRWARREGLKPEEGHKKGFWAIKDHLYPFYSGDDDSHPGEFRSFVCPFE